MNRLLVTLVCLTTCAHVEASDAAPCVTTCGLQGPGNCAELETAERRIVSALARYADRSARVTCGALKGWRVRVHQRTALDEVTCADRGNSWSTASGLCVIGYTHQELREIELPDSDWTHNSFAHEAVHVVDIAVVGVPGHCRWKERGVKAALAAVGHKDLSEPEVDCPH